MGKDTEEMGKRKIYCCFKEMWEAGEVEIFLQLFRSSVSQNKSHAFQIELQLDPWGGAKHTCIALWERWEVVKKWQEVQDNWQWMPESKLVFHKTEGFWVFEFFTYSINCITVAICHTQDPLTSFSRAFNQISVFAGRWSLKNKCALILSKFGSNNPNPQCQQSVCLKPQLQDCERCGWKPT